VAARVGVVGLDDVPEEQGRAAVSVAELERMVDAGAPLAGEDREQADERHPEQEGRRVRVGHEGNREPDRR
jgi:hypothetical protein